MSQEDVDRYRKAMHGMQSGVATVMNFDIHEGEPKHLRVGVNSAMVDSAALAALLIEKGVFSQDEFEAMLARTAEAERDRYVARIEEAVPGAKGRVTLA